MNFFETNRRFHVQTFDMQDDMDANEYSRIYQRVLIDNEEGWLVVEEKSFCDKHGNIFILLKWIEPVVPGNH